MRREEFRRNPELERLLALVDAPIAHAERELLRGIARLPMPILLIVGCARSGSTLLLQMLAKSGAFGYPSNLLSRFHAAPVLGAAIQKLLFDPACRYRQELDLVGGAGADYRSALGKTEGALSPNEFTYFWRRWVPVADERPPTLEEADGISFGAIRDELVGLASFFGRPFALKAHILNWVLPRVAEELPDACVVFLRRDPLFTAQSLLEARTCFSGTEADWYSFKPPEYDSLRTLSPESQVAGQVRVTERAIEAGIRAIEPSRVLEVAYERLTAEPAGVWEDLATMLARHPASPSLGACPRTRPFRSANVPRLPRPKLQALSRALDEPLPDARTRSAV